MPWGDRTGPAGMGPMTGRAAGYCAGYPVPGYANPYGGRFGIGFGRGGWGYRWRYYATGIPGRLWWPFYGAPMYNPAVNPSDEKSMLENIATSLKKELEAIEKRISELEKSS
ncbi:DUF5320 domain-containing protein [bacterium]|nr:DUF5320 domain-containing protein [bacterium]